MFDFEQFSRKQLQAVYWWHNSPVAACDMIICDGSIRSGKTIAELCGFMLWSQAKHSGQSFIVAGKTVSALKRNVVMPLLQILEEWDWDYKYNRSENFITVGSNTYFLFGASTEAAQDVLQGMTAAGAFMDEAGLYPKSFFDQAIGRCSVAGAKIWVNCNPGSPFHWLKVDYIDKAKDKHIFYLHFTLRDNPSLPGETILRYERMFSGAFHSRYILGLWVQAEGLIYQNFDEARHLVRAASYRYSRYMVSCDYGTQNPQVYLLWGMVAGASDSATPEEIASAESMKGSWIAIKEYYHDGRVKTQKTDAEYYADLVLFVDKIAIERVVLDPSASSFKTVIKRHGQYAVKNAVNDVQEGILNTMSALQGGMIYFDASCTNTVKEFHSYVWDSKAAARGEDKPAKTNDHCMDCIRYHVNTLGRGVGFLR